MMKHKFSSRSVMILAIICLGFALSSCGLLVSKKRTLRNRVIVYKALLSKGDFHKASNACHPKKFIWINSDGKKRRGGSAIREFHDSIKSIDSRTGVEIAINQITEVKKDKEFVVTGYILVKQSDTTSLRSVKLFVAMTWKTDGKGWRIMKIKETAKRGTARS